MTSKNVINKFEGQYRWLSNFWHCKVEYEGQSYQSSEAAFQAAKTLDENKRQMFEHVTAGQSKKMGRKLELRPDWEKVKDDVMYNVLKCKFDQNTKLKEKLINTGDSELVEGNWWGDQYWGVCRGEGQNKLGKILMKLRKEYIKD